MTTTPTAPTMFQKGDGASFRTYSDVRAGTIIEVYGPCGIKVLWQRDKATLLNGANSGEPDALKVHPGGFCAHVEGIQRYDYERDPDGMVRVFTLRGNGKWKVQGAKAREDGMSIFPGRREHYDFNF